MEDQSYCAMVQKVIPKGAHGPYAVASSEELGLITFSLEAPAWTEKDWPEGGSMVILSDIRKKLAGWRASRGRFLRPSDTTNPNQDQKKN